ncbi:hypothetical protein TURU_050689 [Turdus rufiventris]|nr:hypothetical protein TURU_050689 [Turdus rufiventris]
MSQADPELLLRELGAWDWQLCRRELPAVLPRLLISFPAGLSGGCGGGVLRILTEMFLPHISLEDLEETFFSKVLPKAVVQLLETLTGCVRYVCSLQELSLQSIHSLPSSVLWVVKSTFTHCKDSESVYCGHLHLISDLLQAMFKEAYSLQKQLMELFDLISISSASSEEDITCMVSVIHTVLEMCSVISNMDHALHANTWKFIIKQSLKHHSLLQCHLKHSDILGGLCKDTLLSFDSCLQLAEQMKVSQIQERALLDAVLGSSMITSLLAMDSWCFLARYGTAELCAHHVNVIAHLVEFARKFPPEEVQNLAVWQHVSLRALNPDLRAQVSDEPCLQWTLCLLLHLSEFFIQALDAQLMTQVFALQSSLLQLHPPDHVRLAVVDFLSSMGKVFIPQEAQRQVVPQLSCLFASLLADQTWLIHQHALEAFAHFAEETRHEDVVPWCLNSEEAKNKVVNFLAKTRQVEETREARRERLKQERSTWSAQVLKVDRELESSGEPVAKRACHPPSEEQYKVAVGTMEGAVEAVKLLLQKGPPPGWLAVKLEALHAAMATLRDNLR